MTRGLSAFGLGFCLLLVVPGGPAWAVDLPLRKPGLWEMKVVKTGSSLPEMTMQHCTDEATDKDLNNLVSPSDKQICSKQEVQKTATGYVADSLCSVAGVSISSHSEIIGDFNSAYTVATTSHSDMGSKGRDVTTKIEAKWLSACKPDQKPGDMVMPGGFKLNAKDAQKLRDLLPK